MRRKDEVNINTISDFFLSKGGLTQKKLQKIVYYAYAWYIALNNQDENDISYTLFNEEPEAWVHGPVFPSLYAKYKDYTYHEIEPVNNCENKIIYKELVDFLNSIWNVFGKYNGDQLEYMTHHETPWKNARIGLSPVDPSNNKISKKDIFVYYNKLANEE